MSQRILASVLAAAAATAVASAQQVPANATRSGNQNLFGAAVSNSVSSGGSYGGWGSYVDSVTFVDAGGAPAFFSNARIRAGLASGATTVNMQWRTPTLDEYYGTSTNPTMPDSAGYASLLSDVVDLTGIRSLGETAPDGRVRTDVFALEMSYQDGSFLTDLVFGYGSTVGWTEEQIAAAGELRIGWLNGSNGQWQEYGLGNFAVGTTVVENYQGSWDAFAAANSITDGNLSNFLGSWGVDTVGNKLWAIFDHNTQFATLPAPGAVALLGLAGVFGRRRTR